MSWENVEKNINLSGFTDDEAASILGGFEQAYEGSARAREMLDQLSSSNTMDIYSRPNAAFAAPASGNYIGEGFLERGIYWDPGFEDNVSIIDDTGTVGSFTEQYVLLHEAVHLIEGLEDLDEANRAGGKHFTGDADYLGDTERVTKEILDELGIDMQRVSYASAGPRTALPLGTEYTNNEPIDAAIVTGGSPVYTDQPGRDASDLVVGLGNANVDTRTGGGRDFVRTGGGVDTIDAGAGNDDVESGAGIDTIIAGSGDDRVDAGRGADIMVDGAGSDTYIGGQGLDTVDFSEVSSGRFSDPMSIVMGADSTVVTRDPGMFSAPETDVLTGVETVVAPSGTQVARIEGLEATSYLDMGAGRDRVEIDAALDGAYVLDLSDGVVPPGTPGAGEAYTASVSNGSETVYIAGVRDADISDARDGLREDTGDSRDMAMQDRAMQDIPLRQAIVHLAEDETHPDVRDAVAAAPEDAAGLRKLFDDLHTSGVDHLSVPDPLPEAGAARFKAIANAGIAADSARDAGLGRDASADAASPEAQTASFEDRDTDYDMAI